MSCSVTPQLQTRDAQTIDLKEGALSLVRKDDDEGFVAGWASTGDTIDSYRTVIAPDAFVSSIAERGLDGPKGIKLLVGHDWDKPAGKITKLEQRDKGLWIEARLDLNISYAKDFYYASKANGGLGFSVGFMLSRDHTELRETDSGEEYLLIKRGELREVSVVANPSNENAGMLVVRNEETRAESQWRVGAARNLPVGADSTWNGSAAKQRIFAAAGFDDDDPDPAMARQAFLVYDATNPNLKGSYKLPFADIVGGRLRAMPAGLRAAASRLPQTDIPESVMARARSVIDAYQDKMDRAAENLTLTRLQEMLEEEGWVKAGKAEDLTTIIRANLHLFTPKSEPETAEAKAVENLRSVSARLSRLFANQEG